MSEYTIKGLHAGQARIGIGIIFSRRWFLATILVVFGVMILARLGIWQLNRLEKRRAFNARVETQISQPTLDLNAEIPAGLAGMEYRSVVVAGEYDHAHQVVLRNQASGNRIGVHLLTPLQISGSEQVILVDRGWVPIQDFTYDQDWSDYDEPGLVEVAGVLRASQDQPDYGSRRDQIPTQGERLAAWYFANLEGIQVQLPYDLLPAYVQQAPQANHTGLPERTQPKLELTEGPHMGYALQWFTFAAILGIGYPIFIRKQERARANRSAGEKPAEERE